MSYMGELNNDSAVYRTLLESTKAIPWRIDWASKRFTYIGPQIEELLGWTPESWMSVEDWAARMHPEDREHVVSFCVAQSQAGVDHEADYRALTKDNGYVWIRDVVHVVRTPQGEPEALVGFMFDISERKKTEEKLLALQKELEALSFKDGLTNIANRRRFDACLQVEWESARTNRHPLSLLLFDIDYFKQYNDLYGHVRGDKCLVDIAQTLSLALDGPPRPGRPLWRRRIHRAATSGRCQRRPQGGRTLPTPGAETGHRPRAVTPWGAHHGEHWRGHADPQRGLEALGLHRRRGSTAVRSQEERSQPGGGFDTGRRHSTVTLWTRHRRVPPLTSLREMTWRPSPETSRLRRRRYASILGN
jgi:PAS domain S-box-containing protein